MLRFGMLAEAAPSSSPSADVIRWRSHPLVDEFPKSLLLAVIILAVCVGASWALEGLIWGVISALLLVAAMARYIFPSHFQLDADGVTVRFLGVARRMPWTALKRMSVGPGGMFLSPFERPSRLDSFRGVALRFAGNADEVVAFVRDKMATISEAA